MKTIIVCVLALVGLALAGTDLHPRGCIYINGHCDRDCEVGTRAYTTGCGYLTPEATCEEPNPVADQRGHICDYTACYCKPGTVRHTPTKTCVKLEDCEKLDKEPEKLHKEPENLDKEPEKLHKGPAKLDKEPEKLDKEPAKLDKEPEKLDKEPEKEE